MKIRDINNWWEGKVAAGIKSYGMPVLNPTSFGTMYFVNPDAANASDNNSGKDPAHPFSTIPAAYAAVTTNKNDIIVLSAYSTHSLTSMLTVSKNRIHFVGMDGGGRLTAQRTKVELTGSTGATNVGALKNTGMGNSYRNMKIMNSHTVAQSLYGMIDAGEAALWGNCSFHNLAAQHLTDVGAAALLLGGDGTTFDSCEIGADTVKITVASGQVILVDASAAGGTAKRNYFSNCTILCYTSQATLVALRVDAEADLDRFIDFSGCRIINFNNSTGATMTNAMSTPSGMDGGRINVDATCAIYGISGWATAGNNAGIRVCGVVPSTATSGIGITPTHA